MARKSKQVPVEAVQELADKSPQAASIGGTDKATETGVLPATPEQTPPPPQNQVQVNVDLLKTMRPHLAMPCYGGMLTESTFMSYIKWANTAKQLGIEWTLETMVNESLINRARNTLTAKFLEMATATHLMFIDADIGWEPWHLLVLLNRDKDAIGGLYPMKTMPIKWVVNGFDGAEEGPEGLQEVSKTGTGFLLLKRAAFDVMAQHPAVKPYKNDIGLDPKFDRYLRTYFDTAVRQNRLYSEDWTMCENFRDMGGKIWVDKRVLLRHTGTYTFCVENQQQLFDSIGPQYFEMLKQQKGVRLMDKEGIEITNLADVK